MRVNRARPFAVRRVMPASRPLLAVALLMACLVPAVGCRVSVGPPEDIKGSSSGSRGTPTPAPTSTTNAGDASPEVQGLFGTMSNATPDKRRGVWSDSVTSNGTVTDLRYRFDRDRVVAGVKCTSQGKELVVGDAASV